MEQKSELCLVFICLFGAVYINNIVLKMIEVSNIEINYDEIMFYII